MDSTYHADIARRLERIEAHLETLLAERTMRDYYSVAEAADRLGRKEFTVREWCRLGRVNARKRGSGRGPHREWVISHEELERVRREGLLPERGRVTVV